MKDVLPVARRGAALLGTWTRLIRASREALVRADEAAALIDAAASLRDDGPCGPARAAGVVEVPLRASADEQRSRPASASTRADLLLLEVELTQLALDPPPTGNVPSRACPDLAWTVEPDATGLRVQLSGPGRAWWGRISINGPPPLAFERPATRAPTD